MEPKKRTCSRRLPVLLLLFPAVSLAVDFDRDIGPILSDNCFACHGPDEKKRMANLRFDVPDGGVSKVVVPGDAANSRLFQRISAADKAKRMPPPYATTTLSSQQVDLLKQWID